MYYTASIPDMRGPSRSICEERGSLGGLCVAHSWQAKTTDPRPSLCDS